MAPPAFCRSLKLLLLRATGRRCVRGYSFIEPQSSTCEHCGPVFGRFRREEDGVSLLVLNPSSFALFEDRTVMASDAVLSLNMFGIAWAYLIVVNFVACNNELVLELQLLDLQLLVELQLLDLQLLDLQLLVELQLLELQLLELLVEPRAEKHGIVDKIRGKKSWHF